MADSSSVDSFPQDGCSFADCKGGKLSEFSERVEVKTTLPSKGLKTLKCKLAVSWKPNGDAIFHTACWDILLKAAQSRRKVSKNDGSLALSTEERVLVKEAAKTVEFHDSQQKVKDEGKRVAELIKKSSHCVVFTGAGISTSAGIGDYRGKSGKWTSEDRAATDIDSKIPSQGSPVKKCRTDSVDSNNSTDDSIDEEDEAGVPYEDLRPTYTHEALKKLMDLGLLKYVISQNGDGLHGLSGIPMEKISELHGNVFIEKCEKCEMRYARAYYVMDDVGSQYFEELEDYGESEVNKPKHAKKCSLCGLNHRTGRKCDSKTCKGYLCDTIINFRDNLEDVIYDRAVEHSEKCDLMLALGTTLTVTPASNLVELIKKPQRLVICNRQQTDMDSICDKRNTNGEPLGSRIFGDCDRVMKELMQNILIADDLKSWESKRDERLCEYDMHRRQTTL